MSARGGRINAIEARNLLITTAQPVNLTASGPSGPAYLDSVAKQGGGLVNVYRAVHHTTKVSPSMLLLNDTAHAHLQQTIQIVNAGTVAQGYAISHEAAATLLSMNQTSSFWNPFPVPTDPRAAAVDISTPTFSLAPGESRAITVTVTPPSLDPTLISVYSGWIIVSGDAELGSVRVPYFGAVADLAREEVFDRDTSAVGVSAPFLCDPDSNPVQNESTIWTFQDRNGTVDVPGVAARFRLGVARVTVDLVHAEVVCPASILTSRLAQPQQPPADDLQRPWRSESFGSSADHTPRKRGTPLDAAIIGRFYEGILQPRDALTGVSFFYTMDPTVLGGHDGNQVIPVTDGKYRILLRVSKAFSLEGSYESYLTPPFEIRRPSHK